MYCGKCGAASQDGRFCPACGSAKAELASTKPPSGSNPCVTAGPITQPAPGGRAATDSPSPAAPGSGRRPRRVLLVAAVALAAVAVATVASQSQGGDGAPASEPPDFLSAERTVLAESEPANLPSQCDVTLAWSNEVEANRNCRTPSTFMSSPTIAHLAGQTCPSGTDLRLGDTSRNKGGSVMARLRIRPVAASYGRVVEASQFSPGGKPMAPGVDLSTFVSVYHVLGDTSAPVSRLLVIQCYGGDNREWTRAQFSAAENSLNHPSSAPSSDLPGTATASLAPRPKPTPSDASTESLGDPGATPQAWNALPNTALDCAPIGLDNQTEVLSVDTRDVKGDGLTFVVRSCLVGTGGAPEVIEVYKVTGGSPALIGVMLEESDSASSSDVTIDGQTITVTATRRLPDDPCCPSGKLSREYRYSDGRVKEIR